MKTWRAILDTVLDAAVVMDRDGKIVDWNDNATLVFGWTHDEAVTQGMGELIVPVQYRAAHYAGLERFLKTGQAAVIGKRIEITALRKSGEEFPIELSIAQMPNAGDIVFVGFIRDLSERNRADAHQKLLLAELNHRVKNMLAVVAGIASQTVRNSKSFKEFSGSFFARLQALGRAHSLLTAGNWETTPLQALIEEILSPYANPGSGQFQLRGPPVDLRPKVALALGMILHELVTNAAKYGALSVPTGTLSVQWTLGSDDKPFVDLHWREAGIPALSPPQKAGFGTTMIQASIQHELAGEVKTAYRDDGIQYDFRFPLTR